MLNDKYIYVFVRQDLTIPQQLVHTNHSTFEMAKNYFHSKECDWNHVPALIVIGMPNEKAMSNVLYNLMEKDIYHYDWIDSEHKELGLASITTWPLDLDKKQLLKNYRLYKPL